MRSTADSAAQIDRLSFNWVMGGIAAFSLLLLTLPMLIVLVSSFSSAQSDPLSIGTPAWPMPDFSKPLPPVRLAFSASLGILAIDPEVETVFQQAIAQIATHHLVKAAHPDCSMARATCRCGRHW